MGFRASGGTAALPIWIDVMRGWLAKHKNNRPSPPPPPGITLVKIDERTGLLPSRACRGKTVTEAFVRGTEPTERCRPKNKRRRLFSRRVNRNTQNQIYIFRLARRSFRLEERGTPPPMEESTPSWPVDTARLRKGYMMRGCPIT